MVRKLKTFVWVGEERYGPDKPVPDDIAKKITNPDVWAEDDGHTEATPSRVPPAPSTPPVPEAPLVTTDTSSDTGDSAGDGQADDNTDSETGTVVRPAGNASREVWATYASSRGVDVTGQMGRDEIKSAVDQFEAQQTAAQQGQ